MANTILLKRNGVSGTQPTTADLQVGEVAINTADLKLFCLSADGSSIIQLAGYHMPIDAGDIVSGIVSADRLGSGTANANTFLSGDSTWEPIVLNPAGSDTQVQYNKNGVLAADGNLWYDYSVGTLYATYFAGDGFALENLDGRKITYGPVPTAVLGSGTADNATFLRGDNTWQPIPTAPVTSVAGRTGDITLSVGDVVDAAPLDSPIFTGTPLSITPPANDDSEAIATTAWVTGQNYVSGSVVTSVAGKSGVVNLVVGDVTGAAPLLSPALVGTPTAPTPTDDYDNSTKIATTQWVTTAISNNFVAAGPAGAIQYNNGGLFGGDSRLSTDGVGTLTATRYIGDGSTLTNLDASNLASGTVATARLGSGTANLTTFLRGDNSWQSLGSMAYQESNDVAITGGTITGMPTPTSGTDVANKSYVDNATTGLSVVAACRLASTTNLPVTYNNGASGVGATLTNASTPFAFGLDGVNGNVGDRVLIKDQTVQFENGIYSVTTVGSGTVAWMLTRVTDWDESSEMAEGDYTVISEGDANKGTMWIQTGDGPFTVGTTSIIFTQLTTAPLTIYLTGDVTGSGTGTVATTVTTLGGKPIAASATIDTTDAANISSGTLPTARLGSGTSNANTYLRGDQTWAAVPVTSVFSRTGAVVGAAGDYTVAEVTGAAPLASPAFTGTPTAPTPNIGDNSTSVATTAFVTDAITNTVPAGSNKQVQFNDNGVLAGDGNCLFDVSTGTLIVDTFQGDGSGITNLNASNLFTGTVPINRLGTGTANITTFLRGDNTWQTPPTSAPGGASTEVQYNNAGAFAGSPSLTFNPANGTLSATQFVGGGVGLTGLNASNLASGTAPTAVLGSGTANNTVFLRGDQQWSNTLDGALNIALGTLTFNTIGVNVTATWNSSGTIFDAPFFANITNTASSATSKLLDLQVGGTSQFSVGVSGTVVATGAVDAAKFTAQLGTVTVSNQSTVLYASSTLNNAGASFNAAILVAVTNTASGPGSMLMDLRAGTTGSISMFTVDLSGNTTIAGSVTATLFAGSGASLTNLNAGNLATGIVPLNRLGSGGTPSTTTFLRGDNTWSAAGTGTVTSITAGAGLTGGTITGTGTIAIAPGGVTSAMLRTSGAFSLMGNPTNTGATPTDIPVGSTLGFSAGELITNAFGGDVTGSANSFALTVTSLGGTPLVNMSAAVGNIMFGTGTDLTCGPMHGDATISNNGLVTIGQIGGLAYGNMVYQSSSAVAITGGTVTGMPTPVNGSDVANKNYVDNVAAGLSAVGACRMASTVNLTANYSNGTAGVGATLTNSGTLAPFSLDGVTAVINNRVLIKNQSLSPMNGIYSVSAVGSASTTWVLTRVTDWDQAGEMEEGDYTVIAEGTTNAGTLWILTSPSVVTVGTSAVTFTQLATAPMTVTLVGDVTGSGSGNIATTVVSTGGIPFAASATIDATDATNITSGTLALGRLGTNAPSATTYLCGDNTWQPINVNVEASATQAIGWTLATDVPISVGTDRAPWEMLDWGCTLQSVKVVAKTAPTGAAIILDILYSTNNGGTFTSLWATNPSNRPTLAATANTGSTSAFDTPTLTAGTLLRIDVIQIGSIIPGQDLTVQLNYSWQMLSTTGPAGSDTEVQYNAAGIMAGSPSLTFNNTSGTLTATKFVGDGSLLTNVHTSAAGTDTEIQFNQSGTTVGSPNLTYNYTSNILNATQIRTNRSQGNLTTPDISAIYTGGGNTLVLAANDVSPGPYLSLQPSGLVAIRGAASQLNDFFDVMNNAGVTQFKVDSGGNTHLSGSLAIQPGTATAASAQSINNTTTWNAPGITMANWSILVVDQASAANSNLMQFYVGPSIGTNSLVFAVDKTGTIVNGQLPVSGIVATGTPSASTFLRGDSTWQTPSTVPGGSNNQIQFNNNGVLAGSSAFYFSAGSNLTLVGNLTAQGAAGSGVVTAQQLVVNTPTMGGAFSVLVLSCTFTQSTIAYPAPIALNVTNTASAAGSLLLNLQVGGASKFNVDISGNVTAAGIVAPASLGTGTPNNASFLRGDSTWQPIGGGPAGTIALQYRAYAGFPTITAGTSTSVFPAAVAANSTGSRTFLIGSLNLVGNMFRLTANANFNNTNAVSSVLNIVMRLGTVQITGLNLTIPASTSGIIQFYCDFSTTIVGTAGQVKVNGIILTPTLTPSSYSVNGLGANIDLTTALTFDLLAAWTPSGAGYSVFFNSAVIEDMW